MLGQTARVYDPLGFVTPVTLEGKLLMREVSMKNGNNKKKWSEAVGEKTRESFMTMIQHYIWIEILGFPRCLKPWNAVEDPTLVIFSDGSELAFGCRA